MVIRSNKIKALCSYHCHADDRRDFASACDPDALLILETPELRRNGIPLFGPEGVQESLGV